MTFLKPRIWVTNDGIIKILLSAQQGFIENHLVLKDQQSIQWFFLKRIQEVLSIHPSG